HRTCDEGHHRPNGAAWFGSPVPDARLSQARTPATDDPSSIPISFTADLLAPFAMHAPLARSDYYRASALPGTFGRRRTYPAPQMDSAVRERFPGSSRVHWISIDRVGIQPCSGSIATATPQSFTVASPPARLASFGVDYPNRVVVHCIPAHIHQV